MAAAFMITCPPHPPPPASPEPAGAPAWSRSRRRARRRQASRWYPFSSAARIPATRALPLRATASTRPCASHRKPSRVARSSSPAPLPPQSRRRRHRPRPERHEHASVSRHGLRSGRRRRHAGRDRGDRAPLRRAGVGAQPLPPRLRSRAPQPVGRRCRVRLAPARDRPRRRASRRGRDERARRSHDRRRARGGRIRPDVRADRHGVRQRAGPCRALEGDPPFRPLSSAGRLACVSTSAEWSKDARSTTLWR